jgi:beta-lactamase regulating signal transducer with metallopeptidase domain
MTHTTQALAWTLIHFCWQAAAIAAGYRLLSFALARRSSNARYVAALAAMLLMLVASIATFAWQMRFESVPVYVPATDATTAATQDRSGFKISPVLTPVETSQRLPASQSLSTLLPWIDAFWVIGVVVLSCRSIGGWWLIRQLRVTATVEAPAVAKASFRRIQAALGLTRPVLLRVSSAIAGPVTVGALRAMVLLPLSAATSLSPEELEVVLAHELAHVRRADFFWNLVQTMIETLFFFHPAVWWMGARIRHERELCCDDLALKVCPDPLVYARALFRLEEQRSTHLELAMALDGHQSRQTLRMRIARILGEPFTHTANRGPFSLAAAGALLVLLMLPVPQVMASLNPDKPAAQTTTATQSAVSQPAVSVAKPAVAPARAAVTTPAIAVTVPVPDVAVAAPQQQQSSAETSQQSTPSSTGSKRDYIDQMKAAGYDVDLDKYISMKVQGITAEYALAMSQLGFGKLSADELISCKVQGVSPETIAKMKQEGFEIKSVQDAIQYRIFDITPEYLAELKKQGIDVSNPHEAIQYRIFNVTPEFVSGMKAAGYDNLTPKQLLALRTQDVTPDYARSIRQQFPQATVEDLVKTKIFNIDADFIASAKRHGFNDLNLEKLVKLRISGILDDNDSDSK